MALLFLPFLIRLDLLGGLSPMSGMHMASSSMSATASQCLNESHRAVKRQPGPNEVPQLASEVLVRCRDEALQAAQLWSALTELCVPLAQKCELLDASLLQAPPAERQRSPATAKQRQLQGYLPLQAALQQVDFGAAQTSPDQDVSTRFLEV